MSTTDVRKAYRILGTTDDVTECELCGRTELKGSIVLAVLDADSNEAGIVYYGASCGARAAGWITKDVRTKAKAADDAKREAARLAAEEESRKFCEARDGWIAANIAPDALSNPRKYGYRSSYAMVVAFEQATGRRA